ncbi:dioxygenase family protein [Robertkochia aurantiaca]|uniref:dioxygenase family protein n=1 Tax=Robertkochia aurantiaca TaxID=2873700 RepID=UPI001CCC9EF7|nr:intradiol ring-cleavage dioxygenase [Robertkochia sp. 3YJGBD-33]
MKRKDFLAKGLGGMLGFIGLSSFVSHNHWPRKSADPILTNNCETSPKETRGPFPNKTPLDYIRENIIGDRKGVPLQIQIQVLDKAHNCQPMAGVAVDIWHCDNHGKYSEYGNHYLQREDLTGEHFLRGRQLTDKEGRVSFLSIFPGYYPDRAPHIHVEVKDADENSLLVSQIAFPSETCNAVYTTSWYTDTNYPANESDEIFKDSLSQNMLESITGDTVQGYVMEKRLIV